MPRIWWDKGQRGGAGVTLAYILGAFFLAWLAVVVYRAWRQIREFRATGGGAAGGGMDGEPERLAVVVRDRDNWAEWLVRSRVAAAAGREPGMRVVLVDGGSSDDTPLILERLARRFSMGFCRAGDLGERCRRNARAAEGGAAGPGEQGRPTGPGGTAEPAGSGDLGCSNEPAISGGVSGPVGPGGPVSLGGTGGFSGPAGSNEPYGAAENMTEISCPGPCFRAAGMETDELHPARQVPPVRCVEYGSGMQAGDGS